MTTYTRMADLVADLADYLGGTYTVSHGESVMRGEWADVAPALDHPDAAVQDVVRVLVEDNTYRVLHMTANGVTKGEARLTGTLTNHLFRIVRDLAN